MWEGAALKNNKYFQHYLTNGWKGTLKHHYVVNLGFMFEVLMKIGTQRKKYLQYLHRVH